MKHSHNVKSQFLQRFCLFSSLIVLAFADVMAQTSDSFSSDPFMQTNPSSDGDPFLEQDPFMQQFPDYDDSQNFNTFELPQQQNDLPQEESAPVPSDNNAPPAVRDNQYIDESVIPQGFEERLQQEAQQQNVILGDERQNMVPNIAYGVGTGFIIGSWLATLTANTRRDTLASIGSGIVLGGLIGALIGSRAIILPNPNIPRDPSFGKTENSVIFVWNTQF